MNSSFDAYQNLTEYEELLKDSGALVKIQKINDCEKCIVNSQLTRLLAFRTDEVSIPYLFDYEFVIELFTYMLF